MTAAISGCVGKAISIIRHFQLSGRPLEQRGPDNRGCTVPAKTALSCLQKLEQTFISLQLQSQKVFISSAKIGYHFINLL